MDGTGPCGTAAVDQSLGSAAVATAFGVLPVYLLGALAIQIRADLAVGDVALGLSVSGYFVVSALMSVPAGRLVERVGAGPGMALGARASRTSLLVAGLAGRPSLRAAGIAVAGFANAIGQVSANLALARLVPFGRQDLAYGIKQAAVPAATGIAGLAVPIVALTVGWRWAFIGGAILPIVFGVWPEACLPRFQWGAGNVCRERHRRLPRGLHGRQGHRPDAGRHLVVGRQPGQCDCAGRHGIAVDAHALSPFTIVAIVMTAGAVGLAALSTTQNPYLIAIATLVAYADVWGWNGVFSFAIVRTNPSAPGAATGITQAGLYLGGFAGPPSSATSRARRGIPWRGVSLRPPQLWVPRVLPSAGYVHRDTPDSSIMQEKR